MTTIAICHEPDAVSRFYADTDLQRLRAAADVRVIGAAKSPGFHDRLADIDILTGSWGMPLLDANLLAAAPRLRAVCYAAGSVKKFVTPESYARGVIVTTAMHANAIPVAEVTVALITLANKNWFSCQDTIRADAGTDPAATWARLRQTPHAGNFGSTVGLIGFGAIAREVAARLRSMDLDLVVYDPHVDPADINAAGATAENDLLRLAARCQVVSLHAPDIPATTHMINATVLAAMQDGATFINTARGRLVDEDALVAELRRGRIGAMLDVTLPEPPPAGHPFHTLPNCWLTPHRAGSSAGEVRRMGRYAVDEALRLIAGEPPRYPVSEAMLATMA